MGFKTMKQEKMYNMNNLGIGFLNGLYVISAEINEDNDYVVLNTKDKKVHLSWVGDCCAHCYLAHVNGSGFLVNAVITKAENTKWSDESKGEYEVIEKMGTTIHTTKGTVTFESRVEHNGYYGGEITVSDDVAIDAYSSPRFRDQEGLPKMKSLVDF